MITVKPVVPQDVINLLNEASKLDPAAIRALIKNRVPCSGGLADHPTIQVDTTEDGEPRVGMLGVINGLFGVDENTWGPVIENFPNDTRDPVTFSLNPTFRE
jgi:hypothetical protein